MEAIIQVSRVIAKKSHKLIILKGQNAQEEAIKAFKSYKYSYKLEKSMTDEKSKIIRERLLGQVFAVSAQIVEEEILERSIKQRASQFLSGSSLTKKVKDFKDYLSFLKSL